MSGMQEMMIKDMERTANDFEKIGMKQIAEMKRKQIEEYKKKEGIK